MLTVEGTTARPIVFGSVESRDGRINFRGRDWSVTSAIVRFADPRRIDPYLEVLATARIAEYDVTMQVTGPVSNIEVRFSSTPRLSQNDLLSLVADNSWNEGNVLGEFKTAWPDLGTATSTLERNGKVIDEGKGSDVLGHPFEPLRWLANNLNELGQTLNKGEIVLTGSWVTTRFPKTGEHYKYTINGVGSVEITLTE